MLRSTRFLLPLLVMTACAAPEPSAHDAHACGPAWGPLPAGALPIYVDAAADAGGDGSFDAQLVDLEAALALARVGSATFVAVGPGSYSPPVERRRFALSGEEGGDDVTVAGCGTAETELVAIEASSPSSGSDPELQPVVELIDGIQGVHLRSMTLRGGHGGLRVNTGAGSERVLVVSDIDIVDSVRMGLSITGQGALFSGNNLRVLGVSAPEGDFALGVFAHEGGSSWEEISGQVTITGLEIRDVEGVGVLVDHAQVTLQDGSITDTSWIGGATGRGMQVQNLSIATFSGVTVQRTQETGIFVHMPHDVTLQGCTVRETGGVGPAGQEVGGDGLASSQAGAGGLPTDYVLRLYGSTFENNGRAGGVAEDIEVHVDGANQFLGNGLTTDGETFPNAPPLDALILQGGATMVWDGDSAEAPAAAVELGGESTYAALDIQDDALPIGESSD